MSIFRMLLKLMIVLGMVLVAYGPLAYIANEGFGDSPGLLADSLYWRRMSYVLTLCGAVMTMGSGFLLYCIDRNSRPDRNHR